MILRGGGEWSKNYETNPFWRSNPKKTDPLAPHRTNPFCPPTGVEGIDEDELAGVGGGVVEDERGRRRLRSFRRG